MNETERRILLDRCPTDRRWFDSGFLAILLILRFSALENRQQFHLSVGCSRILVETDFAGARLLIQTGGAFGRVSRSERR